MFSGSGGGVGVCECPFVCVGAELILNVNSAVVSGVNGVRGVIGV